MNGYVGGRLDASLIGAAAASSAGIAFVCRSHRFVESASERLLEAGFDEGQIRTERFGATG